MPWQIDRAALDRVFDAWSAGKSHEDCPLTELPGFRFPERSPMWRFTRVGSAGFVFFVAEPQGVLTPIDIRE